MSVSGVCVCSVDLPRAFVCVKEWEKVSLSLSECTSLSRPFKNRLVTLSHLPLVWKPCGNRTFNPFSIINSSDWFFYFFFYTNTRVTKWWWTCNCDLIWKWCKKYNQGKKDRAPRLELLHPTPCFPEPVSFFSKEKLIDETKLPSCPMFDVKKFSNPVIIPSVP